MDRDFLESAGLPTRSNLDKSFTKQTRDPGRAGGHDAVLNSAALKLAGIDRDTPNPPIPSSEKSPTTRMVSPNGMLFDHAR
jgi:predicted amidohydrolase YtcJ